MDSNHRHRAYETPALPTELRRHENTEEVGIGLALNGRTHDKRTPQVVSSAAYDSRTPGDGFSIECAPLRFVSFALDVLWFVIDWAVDSKTVHQPHQSGRGQRHQTKSDEAGDDAARQLPTPETAEHLGRHETSLQQPLGFPMAHEPAPVSGGAPRAAKSGSPAPEKSPTRPRPGCARGGARPDLFGGLDLPAAPSRRLYVTRPSPQAIFAVTAGPASAFPLPSVRPDLL